jgi:signal transduction histidine kinase
MPHSRLAAFLRDNSERILADWEAFARTLPAAGEMDVAALRDHAREMLDAIATDLETPQTARQQEDKSHGKADPDKRLTATPAQEHGAGRATSGFTISHMVAEFRALRASVIRLWAADGALTGAHDVQDMIRFNEAIDQAIAASITRFSADVATSKETFLAILGHDLRTPLGAIITASRFMLGTRELVEPHLTLATRIATSAERMNRMVNDLLDFTRTRFGDTIPIVRGHADLRRIIHDVVSEVAVSAPSHAINVETTGDLTGDWDDARLAQALTNLLANGVQHGGAGAPVTISAKGNAADVFVTVNNGGTIPPAQLRILFQPMKNARSPSGRAQGHLGLGLYIVEKIVVAHGGTIRATSSDADGTSFTVTLPRAERAG